MAKLAISSLLGVLIGTLLFLNPAMGQRVEKIDGFKLPIQGDSVFKLDDHKDQKAVVVIFTSSHCSWATKYAERLNQIFEKYKDQPVSFVAVNSNDASMSELDGSNTMRKVVVFSFPYLKDESQQVAKMFKATKNPEAYVLIPKNQSFHIAYHGKIDDNPLDATQVRNNYLINAIDAVLAGQEPEIKSNPPSGCNIKWIEKKNVVPGTND